MEESIWRGAGSNPFPPSRRVQASLAFLCFGCAWICCLPSRSHLWPSFFFLFIPLPELFKHPHLDVYVSPEPLLFLYFQRASSLSVWAHVHQHSHFISFVGFFPLYFFFQRDYGTGTLLWYHYYGTRFS